MVQVKFNEECLSLKGKCSGLKFVIDNLNKIDKTLTLSVYSDIQRVHRRDSYALRLKILDGELKSSSNVKLKELIEAYGFEDFGVKGLEKEIKKYIDNRQYVFWSQKVKRYVEKYNISGKQLEELQELF
jgi:hypothetical protein